MEMCNLIIGIKYFHNMCHNKNVKLRTIKEYLMPDYLETKCDQVKFCFVLFN